MPFNIYQFRNFSEYFKELDKKAIGEFNNAYCGSKEYKKAVNLWKVPLEKKKLRKERKLLNPPKIEPPEESGDGILVVHHPDKAVVWPPHPENVFAIVKILGL